MRPLWIVTPTCAAREEQVRSQLSSVLAQMEAQDRLVVVADNTDAPPAGDPRVLLITVARSRSAPLGVNQMRRIGTSIVPPGAMVVELDDHDILSHGALEHVRQHSDADIIYADCFKRDEESENGLTMLHAKPPYRPGLFAEFGFAAYGLRAYSIELYHRAGGWPLDFYPGGNVELFRRMEKVLRGCHSRVAHIAVPLVTCPIRGMLTDKLFHRLRNPVPLGVVA